MDRTIRNITKYLIELLPDDAEYFQPDKLHELGFPTFIVHRIRIELERNLAESMVPPQTDWADMQTKTVQSIWKEFVTAIHDEARLPASYARTVIETAVADVVEMLVQPRKNLPEVIFGTDKKLSHEELLIRMNTIVVYRHFANVLPRYMEKKKLKELTKERCAEIIAKVDKKLTAEYSPLNWAQMLEPLFSLLNDEIDTNLLRLFFEDRDMPRIARQFDSLNTSVNRAQLIEILSSPNSLDLDGFKEEQPEISEDGESGADVESDRETGRKQTVSNENSVVQSFIHDQSEPTDEELIFGRKPKREGRRREDAAADRQPLNNMFAESQPESDRTEVEREPEPADENKSGNALNDLFREQEEEPEQPETSDEREEIFEYSESEDRRENETSDREEDATAYRDYEEEDDADLPPLGSEERPMWQRFMSEEELAELEAANGGEIEIAEQEEDRQWESPVIEPTQSKEAETVVADKGELFGLLEDERGYFVKKIFRGSERAYDEAVEGIAENETWSDASRYIQREVFQRNLVDMYSEEAVDFTDRLQSYFLEKTKS